jgi:hypothetical protein
MNELMNRGLPKWPQMIVTGKQISEDLALEIIRRTDRFFIYQGGNNHDFIEKAKVALRMPLSNDFREQWDLERQYRKKWGYIETEYVTNEWISCSWIGGTHGWCHPNGIIEFYDNVGKWPSIQEVYDDWVKIAAAFPFLDIGVTLMSGEASEEETNPVVSMRISNGIVELIDPTQKDVHKEHINNFKKDGYIERLVQNGFLTNQYYTFDGRSRENAIPLSTLEAWGKKIFGDENVKFVSQ